MPPGSRKQVQSAHKGMKSRLWKIVYVDGVEQSRELLHTDTYNPSKAIIKVGPAAPAVAVPSETPGVPAETPPVVMPPETAPAETGNPGPGTVQMPGEVSPEAGPGV